jgi:hypothetical protein
MALGGTRGLGELAVSIGWVAFFASLYLSSAL